MITQSSITGVASHDTDGKRATTHGGPGGELRSHYAALLRHVRNGLNGLGSHTLAVGLTSCDRGEGVTTAALNLAVTGARSGNRRVLLVDTNDGHHGPEELLGVGRGPGLSEVLAEGVQLGECVTETNVDGVFLLRHGERPSQLGLDYDVSDVADLLDELKSEFEFIVFDLPKAHELTECFALSDVLDGVLLLVEEGRVDLRVARRVGERLSGSQSHFLGVVYNKQR